MATTYPSTFQVEKSQKKTQDEPIDTTKLNFEDPSKPLEQSLQNPVDPSSLIKDVYCSA
jgi:hypothetical protein